MPTDTTDAAAGDLLVSFFLKEKEGGETNIKDLAQLSESYTPRWDGMGISIT